MLKAPAQNSNDEPTLNVGVDHPPRLSRSPRPYHRRKSDAAYNESAPEEEGKGNQRSRTPNSDVEGDYQSNLHQPDSGVSASYVSSGNASENEQETSHGFKALPAPAFRPHKGLKLTDGADGDATPLLTPSLIEEEDRRLDEYFSSPQDQQRAVETIEFDAVRKKVEKRRNAEFLRRSSETTFMFFLGVVTFCSSTWSELHNTPIRALLGSIAVYVALVGIYPVGLILSPLFRDGKFRIGRIRVPANYDPATLLYPMFTPCLVATSLSKGNPDMLLLNLVLGLSSLPARLMPHIGGSFGAYSLQWLLSIVPLIASENTAWPSKEFPSKPYKLFSPRISPETLTTIFALHQAILKPLNYLTTSSLLPSELHLLSASLINLMLLADSPPSKILNYLIWVGGVGLLTFCAVALEHNVALERVPDFLFGTTKSLTKSKARNVVSTLQHGVSLGDLGEKIKQLPNGKSQISNLHKRAFTFAEDNIDQDFIGENADFRPSNVPPQQPNRRSSDSLDHVPTPKRRQTFSADKSVERNSGFPSKKPSDISLSLPFLEPFASLTKNEANFWKWMYSVYTYGIVILLILGPIRYLVGTYALDDQEPFGWAIGYLFGGIPLVRDEVRDLELAEWVHIPLKYCAGLNTEGLAQGLRCYYGEANVRIALFLYLVVIICAGLAAVLILGVVAEVDTRRKVFHGMMVGMLLPTIYVDPAFLALALGLVLAVFLLLDIIRAGQLRPLSKPIARFLAPYVDGRDLCGPVIVSHVFLLIGCAIPLWLSLAGIERAGEHPWRGWELRTRDASMVAGVVCVGMGDAAASLIGRRYGRHKWPWAGGKSLEGSAAFAVAVTVGLTAAKLWIWLGGWTNSYDTHELWITTVVKCVLAASGASFTEAVLTGCNDNVVVPVVLWLLVRAFKI